MRSDSALHHVPQTQARPGPLVIACGLNRHQQAFARDGLRRSACQFVDGFDELDRLLAGSLHCDVLVLAPEDRRGRSALPSIKRVAREWPETAIVALCPPRTELAASLHQLVLAGVHQLVFDGMHDTASALAVAVETARRECAADRVYRELGPLIPADLHSIVTAVLGRPETMSSVTEVANLLGVHRKTLVNRCSRAGFLQPAELIVWCRLALVAHFLERTGSTVESLALNLGFASHTSLRNLIKRYTRLTATDVRRQGGLDVLLMALQSRVAARPTRALPTA